MENGESVLDAIFEEDNLEDVEMMDVEEGELVVQDSPTELRQNMGGNGDAEKQESVSKNRRRRNKKKKKNKKKTDGSGPKVMDINRFVLDACRRLREKKTYLVYTAVGCLGVSVLSDLIKEVDAIQACGGQKTSNGNRCRTGGGILWNILKTREPNAYKEIMTKGKEFEKQFRQQNIRKDPVQNKKASTETAVKTSPDQIAEGLVVESPIEDQPGPVDVEDKRRSVHDRLRVPVHYDDLFEEEEVQEAATDGTALICD